MIIDSHIHLNSQEYQENLSEFIGEAQAAGVKAFINIGSGNEEDGAVAATSLADRFEGVFATVGVHPLEVKNKIDFQIIRDQVQHPKVVGIGETGLDFYYQQDNAKDQERYFRWQIELAHEYNKKLVIHSRQAAQDCLRILKEMEANLVGGVFHCYSEDAAFAAELKAINFMVSFPGVLTFKKADQVRETAAAIPIEQIMIETDGPFLAPEPFRGKLCRPVYIVKTAEKLAEVKNLSFADCSKTIYNNTIKFFDLKLRD